MKKIKPFIRMIVIHEEDGFSAFATVDDKFIVAMGDTFDHFLDNLVEAVNICFEEEGISYTLEEIYLVSSKSKEIHLTDAYKTYSGFETIIS